MTKVIINLFYKKKYKNVGLCLEKVSCKIRVIVKRYFHLKIFCCYVATTCLTDQIEVIVTNFLHLRVLLTRFVLFCR